MTTGSKVKPPALHRGHVFTSCDHLIKLQFYYFLHPYMIPGDPLYIIRYDSLICVLVIRANHYALFPKSIKRSGCAYIELIVNYCRSG